MLKTNAKLEEALYNIEGAKKPFSGITVQVAFKTDSNKDKNSHAAGHVKKKGKHTQNGSNYVLVGPLTKVFSSKSCPAAAPQSSNAKKKSNITIAMVISM